MSPHPSIRFGLGTSLCVLATTAAFAQMGPPGPGPAPGNSASTTSRRMNTGVVAAGMAGGVAVGGTLLYLAHRGRQRNYILGCVAPSSDGNKMMNEKDYKTYALLSSYGVKLERGQRLKLYGKTIRGTGRLIFDVQALGQDYGTCSP